ncbi:MAG TPA: PepSY-associated TM helix domain-containing protein [Methylomirabilota bacterium]|jgi:uncharacterized iron-regulated membrane protein
MLPEAPAPTTRRLRAIASLRRLAARFHLWGGLVTGPLVLVLGLSGMVLVFRGELDAIGQPPASAVGGEAASASLDRVVAVARLRYPGAEVHAVRLPAHRAQPYRVELLAQRQHVVVGVDPARLHVIGGRAAERSLLLAVHSLHAGFHAGRAGAVVVALVGAWLVIESVSGLWLCWPAARRRPLTLGARRHGARSRTFHRIVGGASLAVGLIVTLTGIALALANAFTPPGDDDAPPSLGRRLALDVIAERARLASPGAVRALVAEPDGTVRVEKTEGDVVVDAAGTIVAVRAASAPISARELLRRLHYGDFGGWPSRLAWALVGLALPVLALTGYLISSRRAVP